MILTVPELPLEGTADHPMWSLVPSQGVAQRRKRRSRPPPPAPMMLAIASPLAIPPPAKEEVWTSASGSLPSASPVGASAAEPESEPELSLPELLPPPELPEPDDPDEPELPPEWLPEPEPDPPDDEPLPLAAERSLSDESLLLDELPLDAEPDESLSDPWLFFVSDVPEDFGDEPEPPLLDPEL